MNKWAVITLILIVGFSYFVTANHLTGDAQKNQIISWNNKLISYSNIAKLRQLTAVELSDATSISQQRKTEMLDLMKKESSTFFEVTLAKSARDNLPLQVKNNIEEQFDKQGTTLVLIIDYEDGSEEKIYQFDDNKTTYTLHFSSIITKPKSSGDIVSLSGYKLDDNVIAKQMTILKGGGAAIYPFSKGKQKIAIILFSYKDRPYNFPLSFDPYFISEQDFSRVPFQVEEFYSKQSEGRMDVDFTIFRYTLDKDYEPDYTFDNGAKDCIDALKLLNEVKSQAEAGVLGGIISEYNTYVGFFPVEWCGSTLGLAYLGAFDGKMYAAVESTADLTPSVTAHEIGHTRNLDHNPCQTCIMYPILDGHNRIDGGAYFTDEEKKKLGWVGPTPNIPPEQFYIYDPKVSYTVSSVTLAPAARISWATHLFSDSRVECGNYPDLNIHSYVSRQTNNHVVDVLGRVDGNGKIIPLETNTIYSCKLESIYKGGDMDRIATDYYDFVFKPAGEDKSLELLKFIRGDANSDDKVDLSDSVFILSYLYQNGPRPKCLDSADINDDGFTDLSDTVYLSGYLFRGGPAPPRPYPYYDIDTTPDVLIC